ncbi:TIGR02206 family membrane protein [Virgibacillus profundi]|uniref:TIGR02206 family membrane protein n=1 Tax=Virgibacillus profundi TaxID=2024555 RepID=A0A2A2IAN5_9BACI|nr:TIGR02206 family membrane protein [Virgibacillus profundi]PAV28180.1 TIGR02206 family membrane protein [Virgibacillus profundi]PXY52485.1 TIGR02206 family membrane protein [Virgibacillus profundi]
MSDWFNEQHGDPFIAFGTSHMTMLVIYFVGLMLLLLTYKKIKNNNGLYNILRWLLFAILVLSEISYQIYTITNGIWSLREHIPLHLCGIASITGAIALVTHNKALINLTFFIGFIPAFAALVTPELPYDFPHFRFWKFFLHHTAISWVSIFLLLTSSVKVTLKSTLRAYGLLLIYAAFIGFVVNPWLGSNYLYLSATPTASTPLDLLGNGIWYYVNLCLLGLVVFLGLFGVSRIFKRLEKRKG